MDEGGRGGSLHASGLGLGLGLDFRTEPSSEERRDLKTGVALSFGSWGLCLRWWLATKRRPCSGGELSECNGENEA